MPQTAPRFNTISKTKLDWALEIAERGLPVFPLHHTLPKGDCSCSKGADCTSKGKHPIYDGGYEGATTDETKIRAWWKAKPDANIGIHPGDKFAYIDLDVTKGKNGPASLAKYLGVSINDLLKMTYTVQTASGGWHLYFAVEAAQSNRAHVLPGVDVRGQGGHVVAEGSTIYRLDEFEEMVETPYRVIHDGPVARVPVGIAVLLRVQMQRGENARTSLHEDDIDSDYAIALAREFLKHRKPAVEFSGGNQHSYVTAAHLRDRNISEAMCLQLMIEEGGWNERCEPPWDPVELKGIVKNAYNYAKQPMGNVVDLFKLDDEDSILPKNFHDVAGPANDSELPEVTQAKARQKALYEDLSRSLITDTELDAQTGLTEFLIDDWIPFEGNAYVFGKRGGGKTATIVDLCLNGQADRKWLGVHDIEKGCTFIYIALEDETGVNTAIQAWKCAHPEVKINPRRFKVSRYRINAFVKNAKEIMKTLAQVIRDNMDHKRVIFIFDTQQRFAPGSQTDEDKMADASAVAESYAKEFKGASIILGHSPKSNEETLSGSGILENNSFALISLNKIGNGLREMRVLRIKGAPEESYSQFEIVGQVIPGLDKKGQPRTGGVVKYRGGTTDAGQGLMERLAGAEAKAKLLVEDIYAIIGTGEHALNEVAKKCGGQPGAYCNGLEGGQEPDRKLDSKSTLNGKLKALAGTVWALRNGTHELEVIPGNGGTGPGTGGKVIIRKLLPGN